MCKVKLRNLILGNLDKDDNILVCIPTFYRKITCMPYMM